MPRAARLDTHGTLHHVIMRGIERRHIIDDNQDRRTFIEKAKKAHQLDVSTSVIAKIMRKHEVNKSI